MKKLEIYSLHPVVSRQPQNPQNYNNFRFGAILLCIAKFLFFFSFWPNYILFANDKLL